jgi:hypothetical protein
MGVSSALAADGDDEHNTVGMRRLSPGVFNRSAALRCDIRARLRSSRSGWACSPACWRRSARRSFCWTSEASDRAEARSPLRLGVWGVLVTILVDADSHRASIDVGLSRMVGVHASGQTAGDQRHAQGQGQRFDAHCGLESCSGCCSARESGDGWPRMGRPRSCSSCRPAISSEEHLAEVMYEPGQVGRPWRPGSRGASRLRHQVKGRSAFFAQAGIPSPVPAGSAERRRWATGTVP